MLIREQGHTVKLIRSERGQNSPHERQKVIGTYRCGDGPSRKLLASLSDDEQAAVMRWLSVQENGHEPAQHRRTLDDSTNDELDRSRVRFAYHPPGRSRRSQTSGR